MYLVVFSILCITSWMRWEIVLVYQHTFSLLVNGRVDPLGLDQVWPDIVHPNIDF